MIVDAHQHFWQLANPFTDWPTPDLAAIHRDFGPADLAPHLAATGIAATVLVQAAPSLEETRWCLTLAARTSFVKGVVGWIDFAADDAVEQLQELARNPLLKGLRPMIQSISEPGWILCGEFSPVLRAMVEHGLRFDALVHPHQISEIAALAALYPALPIVLDHGGKPDIAAGAFDGWARDVEHLAAHGNVWCKLSGLWTEADGQHGDTEIAPFAQHILAFFGAGRVMWGSDWPVVELAGDYADWFAQSLGFLAEDQKDRVMGGNAVRFYGLDDD